MKRKVYKLEISPIDKMDAVKRLGKLAGLLEEHAQSVMRRTSYSPSEKAMAVADLMQDVSAISKATAALINSPENEG